MYKIQNNVLADALANLDPKFKSDQTYARGILVGAVAALSSCSDEEWPFREAIRTVLPLLPSDLHLDAIPVGWEDAFKKAEAEADGDYKWVVKGE